ncbi:UxaA family hydrolase [Halogeometricum sp. S1BR25-6]|uniref:UxaA family hydrolase n=1 Tax=Halogeometricum salsisoli TaxID=2950536 RepID=A0ABU2GIF3_9EURY|nr:UxaA family hydrolase [Halogeometricum sp. S1BR25-6]MDS0300600.1 UxaA family hydrolase [Halogeometricum sp. S1BR25-6]
MKGTLIDGVALVLHEDDTVATALEDLAAGRDVDGEGRMVTVADDVPFGHTFALDSLSSGETVRKYGEVIGRTTRDVAAGEWVHTHNIESTRGRGDVATEAER